MIKGILPKHSSDSKKAICIMLYDWKSCIGSDVLNIAENMFSAFGETLFEATGSLEDKNSHGSYKRVKKKLSSFLENEANAEFLDLRILSEKVYEEDTPFCPSKVGFTWTTKANGHKSACFFVREEAGSSIEDVISIAEKYLLSQVGDFYGGAWIFPVDFGPAAYTASVIAVNNYTEKFDNLPYESRLTNWRDNIWEGNISHLDGYFREIYPTNYICKSHLDSLFLDTPLSDFISKYGTLEQCNFSRQMYRWDIPEDILPLAQKKLEPSGLILSTNARLKLASNVL